MQPRNFGRKPIVPRSESTAARNVRPTEREVWISSAFLDSSLIFPLEADVVAREPERAIAASQAQKSGAPLTSDDFPRQIWAEEHAPHFDRMPDLFNGNGYWVVSGTVAKVLRSADLGRGGLYPVELLQKDRITPVPGDYLCWNIGNVKTALSAGESRNLRPFGVAGLRWNLPRMLKDGDIAVDAAALEGPDVWIDTILFKSLFVSQGLGSALQSAGLGGALRLHRCRVLETGRP